MFMRFRGGGIGHTVTREWDEFLRNDGATPSNDEDMGVEESQKLDINDNGDGDGDDDDDDDDDNGDGDGDDDDDDDDDDDASKESVSDLGLDDGEELVDDDDVLAQEGYSAL